MRDSDPRGPDLPSPNEFWSFDVYMHRWPFATKAEIIEGRPVWRTDGEPWDERDLRTAERAFPSWRAVLEADGHILTLRPARG